MKWDNMVNDSISSNYRWFRYRKKELLLKYIMQSEIHKLHLKLYQGQWTLLRILTKLTKPSQCQENNWRYIINSKILGKEMAKDDSETQRSSGGYMSGRWYRCLNISPVLVQIIFGIWKKKSKKSTSYKMISLYWVSIMILMQETFIGVIYTQLARLCQPIASIDWQVQT